MGGHAFGDASDACAPIECGEEMGWRASVAII